MKTESNIDRASQTRSQINPHCDGHIPADLEVCEGVGIREARSAGENGEHVSMPRLLVDTRIVYSVSPMMQIIQYTDEPHRTMFWVLAETGIRGGEVCCFSVDDVSFKGHDS